MLSEGINPRNYTQQEWPVHGRNEETSVKLIMSKVKSRNKSQNKTWIPGIHQFIWVLMYQQEELEVVEDSNTHISELFRSLTSFDY